MSERLQQIYKALSAADKAGNVEDAKKLAQAYRAEQSTASTGLRPQRQIKPPTDNAFQYSADQAQRMGGKGIEALGRATGMSQVADYGTSVVAQQDEDIAKGGYAPTHTKSLRETYNEDGLGSAIGWLGEKTAENSVSGGAALVGGVAAAATATVSAPAAAVIGLTTLAGSAAMGAGEAAFEQEDKVGDYDSGLAVGQGILIGILDKFGAGKVIPKSKLLGMSGKEIAEELTNKGFLQAAKEVLKRTAVEGATEVAQEGVSIAGAASRGGEYTDDEVLDRGIESFALGSTNAGVAQGVMGTGKALVAGKPAALSDRAAQVTFAQRLATLQKEGNIDGQPYDLSDLDTTSQTGVRALIDAAHAAIDAEIKTLESDLKPYLDPNDRSLSSQQKADRVKALAMLKQARNKTKSVVGAKDFALLKRLVGDTPDGKRLLNLVKESQEQTKVWNAGLVGGVSKYTDVANPMPTNTNYSGQQGMLNAVKGLGTGGMAVSTGGASLLPQAAIFAGGRMIDKVTGRRSKVKRYIDSNQGGEGLAGVSGTGEREVTRANDIQAAIERSIEKERVAQEKVAQKEAAAKTKAAQKETAAQTKAAQKEAKQREDSIEKEIVAQEKSVQKEMDGVMKSAQKERVLQEKSLVKEANTLKAKAEAEEKANLKIQTRALVAQKKAEEKAQAKAEKERKAAETRAEKERKAAETKAKDDLAEAQRVETTRDLTREGASPQLGSPQDIVQKATGLTRDGVAKVLRIVKANPNTKKGVRNQIDKYEQSVDSGGLIDFEIIRKINSTVDNNPHLKKLIVTPRDSVGGNSAINSQSQAAKTQREINYQNGIDSNRLALAEIDARLDADTEISNVKKAVLMAAISDMGRNLSKDPLGKLQEIQAKLIDTGLTPKEMDMYFKPYLERILGQQRPAPKDT